MNKQLTIILATLVLASTAFAQSETISVAALESAPGGTQNRVVILPAPEYTAPDTREQADQLISVGDGFMQADQVVAAIQTYMRAGSIAGTNGHDEQSEQVLWKLGAAFWRLADKEGDPSHRNVARAYFSQAGSLPIADPRCAKLNASASACGN